MSAWAPAVTEADLAAAQGFAGNGVCGWVLSLDLEVTARGGEGRGSGRQERGWAGMRKRGRGDRNEEEREGRKEPRREQLGCAALASSPDVQVPHLRPLPACSSWLHPSPKRSRASRAHRGCSSQPCFLGISARSAERQGRHAATALAAAWGQVEGDWSGQSPPGLCCLGWGP